VALIPFDWVSSRAQAPGKDSIQQCIDGWGEASADHAGKVAMR
jgi:hypothetical protein